MLGEFHEAETCCRKVIALKPDAVGTYNNLGNALKFQGKLQEAEECYRQALSLMPGYAEAHNNLGNLLKEQGALQEAEAHYRQAITSVPNYADARNNLGLILQDQDKLDDAITSYRCAISIKPDFADAYNNLGNALLDQCHDLRHSKEAEECFRQALRYKPDDPETHLNLAALLADLGRYQEADANYRHVLEIKPGHLIATAGLTMLLERKGDFAAASALVEPLVDAGVDDVPLLLSYAALLRHQDRQRDAVALLEKLLQQSMEHKRRVDVHFALGKLYDELRQHDKAFHHFRQANTLDAKEFGKPEFVRQFDAFLAAFSPEGIGSRPRASNRSKLPVFIVGMPRSGTSLVEQILANHPLVHGAGELVDISEISSQLPALLGTSNHYPQCLDDFTRKNIDPTAQKYLDRLGGLAHNVVRVTDKMPHNFMALGLIDMLFPGARVIHCVRDPVDTCLSIYFQHFNDTHVYARAFEFARPVLSAIPTANGALEDCAAYSADGHSVRRACGKPGGPEPQDDRIL